MSIVGAYVELSPGEAPPLHPNSCWAEADFYGKTTDGLEVSWEPREGEIPANAQVYLAWEPRVYAVWEEEEIENGEDGDHEDDSFSGPGGEEVAPESDEGSGPIGEVEVAGDGGIVGREEAE